MSSISFWLVYFTLDPVYKVKAVYLITILAICVNI